MLISEKDTCPWCNEKYWANELGELVAKLVENGNLYNSLPQLCPSCFKKWSDAIMLNRKAIYFASGKDVVMIDDQNNRVVIDTKSSSEAAQQAAVKWQKKEDEANKKESI